MTSLSIPEVLHGWKCRLNSDDERAAVIDRAFDYRGDVTLLLADGRAVAGYVSNRGGSGPAAYIEMLVPDVNSVRRISSSDITEITFSGRDTAAGRTWEAWLAKVADAEARGEIAELYPEV